MISNPIRTPAGILIPREIVTTDELRAALAATIKDPRIAKFEMLQSDGFDKETAAELSGLNELSPTARANAILGSAGVRAFAETSASVTDTAVAVASTGFRTVGAQAGSSLFNAIGMTVIRGATQNAASLSVAGTVVIGGAVAFSAGKLVSASLGAAAGIAAAMGAGISTALVAWALLRRLR
jgi:hypothetical protein